jgi:hypothetical protein
MPTTKPHDQQQLHTGSGNHLLPTGHHRKAASQCSLEVVLAGSLALLICTGCGGDNSSSKPNTPTQVNPPAKSLNESAAVRLLPPLSPPFDVSEFDIADGSSDLLARKVVLLHIAAESNVPTPVVETLTGLYEKVSQENAAAGIRIVSLKLPDASAVANPAITDSSDPTGTLWLSGHVSTKTLTALFSPSETASEDNSATLTLINGQMVGLLDRSGRVRGRYDCSADGTAERLLQDVGQILPEFSPQEFGYASADESGVTHLAQPPEILDLEWLQAAATRQASEIAEATVDAKFAFTDQTAASGITFDPQIVDDQRWRLLVNHYDHGNGICVADVNSDGHQDLFFVSQTGHHELYFGAGDGTFRNETQASGLAVPGRICVTASFADLDNDGDPDACLTCVRNGNLLFENDGQGHFTEVTEESGTAFTGHSSAPVFFDFDRDGLLDLFLCNVGKFTTEENAKLTIDATSSLPDGEEPPDYYVGRKDAFAGHLRPDDTERSLLFRNLGGLKFEDVTDLTGLTSEGWSGDATPLDANNDGWPDLFVLNMQGHDEYFENQEGKQFVRKTDELFSATSWGAMGVKSFDFDGNGLLDLFVTDMHSDMSQDIGVSREREKSDMQWPPSFLGSTERNIFGNSFFLQRTPSQFEEVSDAIAAENYWPWGLSTGDLNADGFIDAFLSSSMCFPYRYGINSVLLNDQGKTFRHSEFVLGIEPRAETARMKPWFDVSCEGGDSQHPMCQGREGTVRVWSCLGTRSSAILDIDGDGDLDIVTNEFNSRPQVLVSDLVQQRSDVSFVTVGLQGSKSNRDGLGARVTVVIGERRLVQVHDGKSGYLSQGTAPLYFGLGAATQADSIEIDWPSGTKQVVPGPIKSGEILTIEETP